MLVSLTVGKIDAGVCVLLTEDKRLIEFPSILLPPDITSGSIVDVDVSRNFEAEQKNSKAFQALQSTILSTFGAEEPAAPVLRCRNATQTSVVLEWDAISLAMASLRSLSLYRDGAKVGSIPRPLEMTSTKISGLAVDTEYVFHLVLRTSAGTYGSEKLVIKTHKMTDLSGITITPGVMPPQLKTSLEGTVEKIGAKLIDQVRIDTTHFVCTEEKGPLYERAKEMNIPIVVPDWIKGCEREGRLVGVRGYYLNADPKLRQVGTGVQFQRGTSEQSVPQETSQRSSTPEGDSKEPDGAPTTNVIPPTPERRNDPPEGREAETDSEDSSTGEGDSSTQHQAGVPASEEPTMTTVTVEDAADQTAGSTPRGSGDEAPAADDADDDDDVDSAPQSSELPVREVKSSSDDEANEKGPEMSKEKFDEVDL